MKVQRNPWLVEADSAVSAGWHDCTRRLQYRKAEWYKGGHQHECILNYIKETCGWTLKYVLFFQKCLWRLVGLKKKRRKQHLNAPFAHRSAVGGQGGCAKGQPWTCGDSRVNKSRWSLWCSVWLLSYTFTLEPNFVLFPFYRKPHDCESPETAAFGFSPETKPFDTFSKLLSESIQTLMQPLILMIHLLNAKLHEQLYFEFTFFQTSGEIWKKE